MGDVGGLTFVYLAIFAALLVAVLWRSPRGNLGLIAVAGVVGAGLWLCRASASTRSILPALVALVGGVQAASGLMAGRSARFDASRTAAPPRPLRGHEPRQGAHTRSTRDYGSTPVRATCWPMKASPSPIFTGSPTAPPK